MNEIEQSIFSYRNQELFKDVLTKEGDATFKYKNMIDITKKNIQSIFVNLRIEDLQKVNELISKGYIKKHNYLDYIKDVTHQKEDKPPEDQASRAQPNLQNVGSSNEG